LFRWNAIPDILPWKIAGVEFIALQTKLQIFVVYRPPYYDAESTAYLQLLTDCLSVYTSKKCAHVLVGDFTLTRFSWDTLVCPDDILHKTFFDFVIFRGLT